MECNQEVMEEMQEKLTNAGEVVGDIGSGLAANASAIQDVIDVVQFLLDNAEWRERPEITGNPSKGSQGTAVRTL